MCFAFEYTVEKVCLFHRLCKLAVGGVPVEGKWRTFAGLRFRGVVGDKAVDGLLVLQGRRWVLRATYLSRRPSGPNGEVCFTPGER